VDGRNYLIPVGAKIDRESDVKYQAVDVNDVLDEMRATPLKIVILDACRDNPFARSFRSQARGLAEIRGSIGTLIAYATEPGGTAADGEGENSVYTRELLRHIPEPHVPIGEVLIRVRRGVAATTGGKQIPWEAGSLMETFYFRDAAAEAAMPIKPPDIVSADPPAAPASRPESGSSAAASLDRDGVIRALAAYRAAYEAMDVEALRRVYPKFGDFEALRKSFRDLRSIGVAMNPAAAEITPRPDGTIIAVCVYSMTFTPRTGKVENTRATRAQFQLRKAGYDWIVERINYK
jgi:uncharacterized caspase-like protein